MTLVNGITQISGAHHLYSVVCSSSYVSFHHHLLPKPSFTSPHLSVPWLSPHCYLCPWGFSLFFLFDSVLPSPLTQPPPTAVSLLSIYESVSILLVSSFCSLDSTYEWNHVVLVFLWLKPFLNFWGMAGNSLNMPLNQFCKYVLSLRASPMLTFS